MPKHNLRSPSLTSQESCSAVIIADLVAHVPIAEEIEESKRTKEETNFGYDGHLDGDSSPATLKPASMDVLQMYSVTKFGLNENSKKSSSISKGVILNAVQFGIPDSNGKIDEKTVEKSNSLSVQVLAPALTEPAGFKEMSISRKIAFGISFLPSIMFVLCFAIILPCNIPKPCVETIWTINLNNTEATTTNLELNQNSVALTLLEENIPYFLTLNPGNGSINYKEELSSKSTFLYCGMVTSEKQKECIYMDKKGNFHIFNGTKGRLLWEPVAGKQHSEPIILPDCNQKRTEAIALAVSHTEVKVLFNLHKVSTFRIEGCDTVPSKLIPWTRDNVTDIIIICTKNETVTIKKIPQPIWCSYDKKSSEISWTLHSYFDSKVYDLKPIEDGLVLWAGNEISKILSDGSEAWKITNGSHSYKNRFIFYGNFIEENKQVVLFSSDISTKIQISILNSTDGNVLKSFSINASEAIEAVQVEGKKRDFLLLLLKTVTKNVIAKTLEHINAISTTVITYLSEEGIPNPSLDLATSEEQELAFLDLDGTIHSIQKLKDVYSQASITALKDNGLLNIYLLRSLKESPPLQTTTVSRIEVTNWDISASKALECAIN